jgi:HEAT repeat protein
MEPTPSPLPPPRKRPSMIPLGIMAILIGGALFMLWQQSLRRNLSDAQLERYLQPTAGDRDTLHATEEISRRVERKDETRKRFYPAVIALASHPETEKRKAAAWVMGRDPAEESFREPLVKLLADEVTLVRHNAALALVLHRSEAARPVLLSMLKETTVAAPAAGTFHPKAKVGEVASLNLPLGTITSASGEALVNAPVEGRVLTITAEGAEVAQGALVATIGPDPASANSALQALTLPGVGRPEDAEVIEAFLKSMPDLQQQVRDQAQQALLAVKKAK